MGSRTNATIKANEDNARTGTVVPAHPGYFLVEEPGDGATMRALDEPLPILAWRIGNADCDCVLPVTCIGTHRSQSYVLRPDGRVVYHAIGYGSMPPSYDSLEAWREANFRPGSYNNPVRA